MRKFCASIFLATLSLSTLQAQAQTKPCTEAAFRQFDFWIGDWTVYAGEQVVGHNKVESILGACVIMENWTGAKGSEGKSFNTYDPRTENWSQVWVDNSGNTIHFSGKWENGIMAMTGSGISRKGLPVQYSMDYTPNPDGSVHQLWKASQDKGENWQVLFDGLYKKD